MKTCRTCRVEQPEGEFYMHDKTRRKPDCKGCVKAKQRERYETNAAARQRAIDNAARYQRENPERVKTWRKGKNHFRHARQKYGVTRERWAAMLIEQSGRCAICSEPMLKPCIDHDHTTGATRGLLCKDCNTGLGHLKDDVARLRAAIDYLGTFTP